MHRSGIKAKRPSKKNREGSQEIQDLVDKLHLEFPFSDKQWINQSVRMYPEEQVRSMLREQTLKPRTENVSSGTYGIPNPFSSMSNTFVNNSTVSPHVLASVSPVVNNQIISESITPVNIVENDNVMNETNSDNGKSNKRVRAVKTGGLVDKFFQTAGGIPFENQDIVSPLQSVLNFRRSFDRGIYELAGMLRNSLNTKKQYASGFLGLHDASQKLHSVDNKLSELENLENRIKHHIEHLSATSGSIDQGLIYSVNLRDGLRKECFQALLEVNNTINSSIPKIDSNDKSELDAIKKLANELESKYDNIEYELDESQTEQVEAELNTSFEGYNKWIKDASQKLMLSYQETNKAYKDFVDALQKEKNAISELEQDLPKLAVWNRKLLSVTPLLLRHLEKTDVSTLNEKEEHVRELQSYYVNKASDLENIIHRRSSGFDDINVDFMYEKIRKLNSELREAKRALLKLRYKKEEMEIDGARPDVLNEISYQIEVANNRVHECEKQLQHFESEKERIRDSYPEIVFCLDSSLKQDEQLPNVIIDSRLEVKRSIKDYDIVKIINPRVCQVKFANKFSILKQYSFTNETSMKQFVKNATTLCKLNHPCIVKIESFFRENDHIYVQMEYLGDLTLSKWLTRPNSEYEKRQVFHSVAQTLKYVHDHGIIHCDSK